MLPGKIPVHYLRFLGTKYLGHETTRKRELTGKIKRTRQRIEVRSPRGGVSESANQERAGSGRRIKVRSRERGRLELSKKS